MSAPVFVRTGWACITETLCGPYVSLEGTTADDTVPVIFGTRAEAEAERAQYIDDAIDFRRHDADVDAEELEAYLEEEREALESEEGVAFVGVAADGEVYEIDPTTREIFRPLHRPDR